MNYSARPKLPPTTGAPSSLGKSSVYASRLPPHFESPEKQRKPPSSPPRSSSPKSTGFDVRSPSTKLIKTPSVHQVLQEKGLSKIVDRLPYELRESVTSILTLAFRSSENVQKDLEYAHQEISILRTNLTKRGHEMQALQKTCDVYQGQLHGLEETIESLKDSIDSRKRFSNRNRSAMSRLATTNRMLIDALDALQNPLTFPSEKAMNEKRDEVNPPAAALLLGKPVPVSLSSSSLDIPRTGTLSPVGLPRTPKGINHIEYEEKVQRLTMSQNDKLRESLLKIAREHYKSLKNAEHLETKVTELKASLKAQEQLNRNLKSELDEIKAITQVDTTLSGGDNDGNKNNISANELTTFKAKNFGVIDERFQNLLDKNLFDPIDGIQQLRRILAHMANSPNSLSLHEMIVHVVSREAVKIFGSDMICLYLVKPNSNDVIHKFTERSTHPTSFEMNAYTKSIAMETIRTGKIARVNAVSKNAAYNENIDGCHGVVTKRILSLPLFNTQHSLIIGAIHFLNKGKNFDVFTEADEVFGLIFAHQTSLLLTSCVMYDALFYHSQLLRGLLEASTDMYNLLPDNSSLASVKSLTPGEVILAMERTARDLLKCPNVKGFLISDKISNMTSGQLIMLESHNNNVLTRNLKTNNNPITITMPLSGVVGHVITSKKPYIIEPMKFDTFLNPSIDLDPLKYSMLTIPLIDPHGEVIGCLQLLAGNRSPRVKESDDPNDFRLLFPQAAEWFGHQIAPALKHILAFLDQPSMIRPVSTPSRISRSSMDVHHRASFFSTSEEVVNQMLSVAEQFNEEGFGVPGGIASNGGGNQNNTVTVNSGFVNVALHNVPSRSSFNAGGVATPPLANLSGKRKDSVDRLTVAFKEEEKEKDKKSVIVGVDPSVHEALQLQLIDKQKEYEQLFEKLSQMEKDSSFQLKEMKKIMEEDLKMKLLQLEESFAVKIQQSKTEYEKTISSLQTKITLQTEELSSYRDSYENQQSKKETAFSTKINELENQIQEMKKQHSLEVNDQIAKYEEEQARKENEINDIYQQITEFSTENTSLKQSIMKLEDELANKHSDFDRLQASVQQLQTTLVEKEKLQAILQQQIINLAGKNLKDIGNVMEEVNKKTVAPALVEVESQPRSIPAVPTPASATVPAVRAEQINNDSVSFPSVQETSEVNEAGTISPKENISSASPVEDTWVQQKDMLGRTYFYNEKSGQSSWEKPPGITIVPMVKGDWLQHFDESGNEYWVNQLNGESSWTLPEDVANVGHQGQDLEEDDPDVLGAAPANLQSSIYDTNASQFSATAGDYTIEL
jgi:hypothetical protein